MSSLTTYMITIGSESSSIENGSPEGVATAPNTKQTKIAIVRAAAETA